MYKQIDISRDWRIVYFDPDEGLLQQHWGFAASFAPKDFVTADMPATAHAALTAAGRIPHPYFGMNNLDAEWMEQKEWWYLKDFDLPRLDGTYRLTFHGVNYRAEAWLSGVQIGTWEGTFLTKRIDLPPALLKRRGNRLSLRIRCQEHAWGDPLGVNPDKGHKHSNVGHIRTQRPVPQFAHSWNWAPHMIPPGIWRPVTLEWMATGRFEDPRIATSLNPAMDTGHVRFTARAVNLTDRDQRFEVRLTIRPPTGRALTRRTAIRVKAGEDRPVAVALDVPDPKLWWPNGHGEQPLYQVTAELRAAGRLCHSHARRQGFRRVGFRRNTNELGVLADTGNTSRLGMATLSPYPWTLEVNGRRVFVKGTNFCPIDSMMRPREDHLRRLLTFARDAHYVMLRVWGGGLTESEAFYDLCDEMGLLVFQEFWLACGSYPAMDFRAFLESAASEIARLRERTSLAYWCGGNEFEPDNRENRPLVDAIEQLVAELDGTREFRRSSPYRGNRHGGLVSAPLRTTNKAADLLPGRKRIVLMRTECAVGRSAPRPDHIRRFLPKEALWPIDWRQYQNHHAQKAEWEQVTRPFGKADTFEQELLHASVMHCIDNRMNMEYTRSGKYECSGCMTWQLNGSWPSFHREHVDCYGAAKTVYYWYKHACAPVIALADVEQFVVHAGQELALPLTVVSDLQRELNVTLIARVLSVAGEVLCEQKQRLSVPADTAAAGKPLTWRVEKSLAEGAFYVTLDLREGRRSVYRNAYWLAVSPDTHFATGVPLGQGMTLLYEGRRSRVNIPHHFSKPQRHVLLGDAPGRKETGLSVKAVYETRFRVPKSLAGQPLEVFLPGISADDVVTLNGRPIGRTRIDPTREKGFYADPLRWPTLPIRFYHCPERVLKTRGENVLRIAVDGERLRGKVNWLFGLTEQIFLRRRTPEGLRRRIGRYLTDMRFFVPITGGPKADLAVAIRPRGRKAYVIRIENRGQAPAAFLALDLERDGGVPFRFDQGAVAALAGGETLTVTLDAEAPLPAGAVLRVEALNLPARRVKLPRRR